MSNGFGLETVLLPRDAAAWGMPWSSAPPALTNWSALCVIRRPGPALCALYSLVDSNFGIPLAYLKPDMEFVESSRFNDRRRRYLDDEALRGLQNLIIGQPEKGHLIRGGRGLRKIRFAPPGRGKSGGYRVMYYLAVPEHTVYLLDIYAKGDKEDLSPDELRTLAALIKP